MAVVCEKCGRQYDITLFEFGKNLRCDCGNIIDLKKHYAPMKRNKNKKPKIHFR